MVNVNLVKNNLEVSFTNKNYSTFNAIINILKSFKGRYNATKKIWTISALKYEDLRNALEEIDTVNSTVDSDSILEAVSCTPEIEIEATRRIPDYGLLNYSPIIGKSPNENFQRDAIKNCINRSRRAEFLGMGSGKSYITSAVIAHRLLKYKDCNKVVLITSSIGVRNLKYELLKFIKGLDENRIAIANKDFRNPFDDPNIDIVITSYNSFRLICDYYKKALKLKSKNPRRPFLPLQKWSCNRDLMLILDESHNIANPNSQQGGLVALHAPLFKYRYLFSGTPADVPQKWYNQLKVLDPYLVWNLSFTDWKDKMAVLGDRFSPYSIKEWKREELEKQNKRFTALHGEYFKTTDLVDLPNYNEKRIYISMSKKHRDLYEAFIQHDIQQQNTSRDIVNRFPYMCLAVDYPTLLEKHQDKFDIKLNKMIDTFHNNYLEKISAIQDIISDHEDEKIIIWAIHPATIHMLGEKFKKYNPICITGETEQEERFDLVEEFKKGDHKLLIANIACLNTSVTILEAKVQIYVERGFSFSQYEQSTQRTYRIGQDKDVTSYILIYDKSLDVLVDKNLTSKGMLVEGLCSKNFITQDEWIKIFNCSENDQF